MEQNLHIVSLTECVVFFILLVFKPASSVRAIKIQIICPGYLSKYYISIELTKV